jgi:hypothetical protein
MTGQQLANTLELLFVLGLCSIVFFRILPIFRLDSFRQKMFAVRDEMFDFAAKGAISFDDPAYVLLRKHMNGMIRYGHHLTVFRMLMTALIAFTEGDLHASSWQEDWDKALCQLKSEHARQQLKAFHDQSMSIAVKHLLSGSPLLWVAMGIAVIALFCHGAARGTRQLYRDAVEKVFVGPLDRRFIEEAAAVA